MSLEATSLDGRKVNFSFDTEIEFSRGKLAPEMIVSSREKFTWNMESFCGILQELWQKYLDGALKEFEVSHTGFNVSEFSQITEYYLSNAGGVYYRQRGSSLDTNQEDVVYWLKYRVMRRNEPELRYLDKCLDQIIYHHLRKSYEKDSII